MRTAVNYKLAGKTGFAAAIAGNVINFAAINFASNTSVYFVRRGELETGITVKDEKSGIKFGSSKVAAREAINKTMISRLIYLIPVFFVPALWNMGLKRLKLMPKPKTPLGNLVEIAGVALGLSIAMPINCALYP